MIDVISLALSKDYTDKEITKAATSLSFKQKIVESLPSSGEIHTIYFIKNNSSWKDNYYDEYLWIPDTNSFEKIGSTEIPATLPNPNALTFTGAVNASYDGSSEVNVEIPDTSDKMDKNNPTGTGSFSLNRKAGSIIGSRSHAEGFLNTASGNYSHAEGASTSASGSSSHAEGNTTIASGNSSHAEGFNTTASGIYSHAEGDSTEASSFNQHVQGKYNIKDSSGVYADIIGNGTSASKRSNAATVDWSGNAWFAGDVYVGSTSGTNKDKGSKKLATEEYVNAAQPLFIDFYYNDSQSKIVTDSTITLEEMKEIIQKRTVYCRYAGMVLTLSEIHNTEISFFFYWIGNPNNPSDKFSWCQFTLTNDGWDCEVQEL